MIDIFNQVPIKCHTICIIPNINYEPALRIHIKV